MTIAPVNGFSLLLVPWLQVIKCASVPYTTYLDVETLRLHVYPKDLLVVTCVIARVFALVQPHVQMHIVGSTRLQVVVSGSILNVHSLYRIM